MAFKVVILATCVVVCLVGGVSAITLPDTSLDTIPVGYFGGVNCKKRSQDNIDMLAKMRLIVIEKWEGPCWDECYANLTKTPPIPCQPSCGAENYQMETIRRAKMANPKLAAVFYLNTLYDFPFLELHGKFLEAKADVVDVNGKLVAFKNDNGMPDINVFDFSQEVGRDLWTGFIKNLSDSGIVDGLFDDKRGVVPSWNETGSFWQICEYGDNGRDTWNISCGIIANDTAQKYIDGKPKVLDVLYETFGTGIIFSNTTQNMRMKLKEITSPLDFAKDVKKALASYKYCYVMVDDHKNGDCYNTTSSCSTNNIAMFLLGVEKGAILGCNGWDDQFNKPLGEPLGPAVEKDGKVERHFKSGTSVSWDLSKKTGTVNWAA